MPTVSPQLRGASWQQPDPRLPVQIRLHMGFLELCEVLERVLFVFTGRTIHLSVEPDLLCMSGQYILLGWGVCGLWGEHGICTREPRVPVQGRLHGDS